jgi:pilus assembly protein Flp/PilA
MTLIARLMRDESGTTSIEYGLIAMLVAVGAIVAIQTLGARVNTTFNIVSNAMT